MRAFLALCFVASTAAAQRDWPQFRGPGGSAAQARSELPLPLNGEKRRAWSVPVPPGSSSPCVAGDRVYLTGVEDDRLLFLCIDARKGKTLWSHDLPRGKEVLSHPDCSPAMPTPCTDGKRVAFYFGSWGLVVTDTDGKVQWEKRMKPSRSEWGTATSPILVGGNVVLVRDGAADSRLVAFDLAKGDEVWSVPRLAFGATSSTPFLWESAAGAELVVAGSTMLSAFDPRDGAPRWTVTGVAALVCTTPAATKDLLYYAAWATAHTEGSARLLSLFELEGSELSDEEIADGAVFFRRLDADADGHVTPEELPPGRGRDSFAYVDRDGSGTWEASEYVPLHMFPRQQGANVMLAVKPGGKGDVTKTHVAWSHDRGLPYTASPLVHQGRLWLVKDGGIVTLLDARTGALLVDRERLGERGEYYASPIGAKGHVLVTSSSGVLFVLAAKDVLEVVERLDLGSTVVATPALAGGRLFVRTADEVLAFGR